MGYIVCESEGNMENAITLTKAESCWTATFSGPYSEEVMSLFGTKRIVTPFTPAAPYERVRSEIARLNPGVTVI